ncbi:MAG TPA: TerC family protein [Burkholderiales bacterium]|nr:TerC family protein [Burkholderiales bacterium]
MDLFSAQFASALFAIVIIDLVLAGDNAIVIALAARKLPTGVRRKAIVWGTAGAIAVRAVMSLAVVALLNIPGLQAAGGLLLLWIAYRLLAPAEALDEQGAVRMQVTGFWAAIRTIVIADAVMGLDNVLGVAGAAQGSFLLVILGLLISVPIMVWGSSLILRLVDRYPVIIYLGAGVLAWTAAVMLVDEPLAEDFLALHPWLPWAVYALLIGGVLLAGFLRNRARAGGGASSDPAAGS